MKKLDMVFYVPKLDRIYVIAEADIDGFATYTDNPDYPLFWWGYLDFKKYFKNSVYLGEL